MRILGFACLTILLASQSFALSCMPSSIEDSFHWHREAKENYILVTGKLTHKRNVVLGPKTQGVGHRSENFTASFVGRQATRAGFDRAIKATVAVSGGCSGP